MADWPIVNEGIYSYAHSGLSPTAPTVIHTKGVWSQFVAATTIEINYFIVHLYQSYYANMRYLVDIGIGSSGNEEVLIGNIAAGHSQSSVRQYVGSYFAIPLYIPIGTRIATRYQAQSNQYLGLAIQGYSSYGGLGSGFAGVVTYGANTAQSNGLSVDSGGSAWAWGAWKEFSASVERQLRGLIIGIPWNGDTARNTARWRLAVGIGDIGNEQTVINNYQIACKDTDDDPNPRLSAFTPVSIPVGSRLVVRTTCSITDSSNRLLDVILYGVY